VIMCIVIIKAHPALLCYVCVLLCRINLFLMQMKHRYHGQKT